jgi:hypothetical protein
MGIIKPSILEIKVDFIWLIEELHKFVVQHQVPALINELSNDEPVFEETQLAKQP